MRYNKSKTYLLPLLSELIDFDRKYMKFLVNTYMFEEKFEFEECFCILHDFPFKTPDFTEYEHRLINNNLFLKSVDIDNQVLYIFKFPEEYLPEYYHLYNGKYSLFGNDAKELILKFWHQVYIDNPNVIPFLIKTKQILYKDVKLKEKLEKELSTPNSKIILSETAELCDLIDVDEETFTYITNEKESGIPQM